MIKIAFKLGWHNGWFDSWMAPFIMLRTWSDKSHVEAVRSDGWGFSSREVGASHIGVNLRNTKAWRVIEIDATKFKNPFTEEFYKSEDEWVKVCEHICSYMNEGYDCENIFLREVMRMKPNKNNKWYCSEVVAFSLGIQDFAINPKELFALLDKK